MDISSLSLPADDLSWAELQSWVKQAHHALVNANRPSSFAAWQQALEEQRGSSALPALTLLQWLQEHEFVAVSEGPGLSMKGVGFVLASAAPRSDRAQAWEEAAQLLARVAWLNDADERLVSMRVADVLLFGSMTDPFKTTHGDLDALIVFESCSSTPSRSEVFAHAGWTFDQLPSGLPSFRLLAQSALQGPSGFCSLSSASRDLGVLVDQDPGFSCYSLLGKDWTAEALEHTTADEHAVAVAQAIGNGTKHPAHRAHIARELKAARVRLGLSSPEAVAACVQQPAGPTLSDQALWWACLQPLGAPALLGGLAPNAALQQAAIQKIQHQLGGVLPDVAAAWVPPAPTVSSTVSMKGPR